ncbi:glycerophosphoryl diester phosphodiesterase [Bacillus pakistanensis]|uniref:Glycerophosphoryl diester phosphodiesterase n=1 Tax=Rossellomorea pakistanensis TaxID=992288 RepID=A0ABS2N9N8_9BACI|nr:glycerophosphodiester phosphodiesterase [Bacillus pakistanensis]MBM7584562.1 glycerophosphoryl diester phosphodiesterase [Bacillus pakistanensis]
MTLIIAHRGSAGTHPENTMEAFLEAERVGADGIELDVQLSKDGEVVVIHDESIDRTTNDRGFVQDYTLKEIQSFNASYKFKKPFKQPKIPSLREVFQWMQGNQMICNVELKNGVIPYPQLEEKVIGLIEEFHYEDRVILSSFNHYSIVHCYRINPSIEIAPLYSNGLFMPWVYAESIHAKAIHPNIKVITDHMIVDAQKAGVAVRPYTINAKPLMKRLIKVNCAAIITDYPEKAIGVLNAYRKGINHK